MNDQPYLHGTLPPTSPPLGSLLPVIQSGVISQWLETHLDRSNWILCPFGSSPQAGLEAARAGYRVLMPIHNPILRFLVKNTASAPSREDLNSALVKLASSFKGKERLKPYILSLYETDCSLCGQQVPAVAFLWEKEPRQPVRKICRCSTCGEQSTDQVTQTDLEKALSFSDQSPTHARALTRVTSPTDPIRLQVEDALGTYPPRSVYALFTILNKVTGFSLTAKERNCLEVLLLHAFYRCSQPSLPADLPEDLTGSEIFREENVWFAMEDALECWVSDGKEIQITTWPETPPDSGGITIFPGRIKELTHQLIGFPIKGMIMVYPRPIPEFWSLSALWSGWLWGQETAAALRGILSSRDLDWSWMTHATQITLQELSEVLPDQIPVLGYMAGANRQSLLSWASASLAAGLDLENMALDPDSAQGQSFWTINPAKPESTEESDHKKLIREAGVKALKKAGEPLPTLSLYSAAVSRMAGAGYPAPDSPMTEAGDYFEQLKVDFEENIAYRQGFLYFQPSDSWWHQELDLPPLSQSDQVEISLVQALLGKSEPSLEMDLYQGIYDQFPALSSPRSGLISTCLESYAEQVTNQLSAWKIKENDQPASRHQDLKEMERIITAIGQDLGFQVHTEKAPENLILISWSGSGMEREWFYISASGLLGKIAAAIGGAPRRGWIILPGSRAGLIHYKLRHNPVLADVIHGNWELIKFRHLRRLYEQGGMTRENYRERFCLDPFTSDSPQLPLI